MAQRPPVTALISASLFFTGVTCASTLAYGAIVAIVALGISNGPHALLLVICLSEKRGRKPWAP